MFVIPDTSIAMVSALWVGIIAWRGGIVAGLLASVVIYSSNFIVISIPPHNQLGLQYYINNKIPGYLIGLLQSVTGGIVVGYISSLVHQLRKEISLRVAFQKELEQKVAQLDAFGHTVAHDLKNPLMVISMSAESLISDFVNIDNKDIKKKLSYINDGTEHMSNIIGSILLLSGIKKIDPDKYTNFPMSHSTEEALKRMKYCIELNNVSISMPENWPTVFGYAPWITEVRVNYLNNAIKYGGNPTKKIHPIIELGFDKPGTIQDTDSTHIRFWVKDNGAGIAKEEIGKLFKKFTRLNSTDSDGHGLGLSIVNSIVNRLNGTAGVESEIEKGSLFFFTLPVKNQP